ncbi:MAG TPA: hypothetical protein VFQ82_01510 [Stellaceae bacterium]|nr:hypothetical protein [Stellaceae bacterium]
MRAEKRRSISSPAAAARHVLAIAAAMLLLSSPIARAGFITIDPAGIDAIFSQPSFDGTPIAIRFNPPQTIVDPDLLVIKTQADLMALLALAPDPAPTVDAFFVDQIDACGFPEPGIGGLVHGCAQLPGHVFVEESDSAAMTPATLMGHELGHNLDLQHDFFDGANLMGPLYPHGPGLTEDQVAIILESPLVQTDPTGQRFIEITPIAIVAASEPATLLLLGAGLGGLLIAAAAKRKPL